MAATADLPIVITRQGPGFGFTLRGNRWPFFVEKVEEGESLPAALHDAVFVNTTEGGAASSAGLESGDMVVRVNEQSLTGKTLVFATKLVKSSGQTLVINVKRNARSSSRYETIAADIMMSQTRPAVSKKQFRLDQLMQKEKSKSSTVVVAPSTSITREPSKSNVLPVPQSVIRVSVEDHAVLSRIGQRR